MLLSRMMFHRSPRGGHILKAKLVARFDKFTAGQWRDLIVDSNECAEEAATARRRRAVGVTRIKQNAEHSGHYNSFKWESCHQGGRVGTRVRDHPARQMDPIPELPPRVPVFNLGEQTFSKNVRSARRGSCWQEGVSRARWDSS